MTHENRESLARLPYFAECGPADRPQSGRMPAGGRRTQRTRPHTRPLSQSSWLNRPRPVSATTASPVGSGGVGSLVPLNERRPTPSDQPTPNRSEW